MVIENGSLTFIEWSDEKKKSKGNEANVGKRKEIEENAASNDEAISS